MKARDIVVGQEYRARRSPGWGWVRVRVLAAPLFGSGRSTWGLDDTVGVHRDCALVSYDPALHCPFDRVPSSRRWWLANKIEALRSPEITTATGFALALLRYIESPWDQARHEADVAARLQAKDAASATAKRNRGIRDRLADLHVHVLEYNEIECRIRYEALEALLDRL